MKGMSAGIGSSDLISISAYWTDAWINYKGGKNALREERFYRETDEYR